MRKTRRYEYRNEKVEQIKADSVYSTPAYKSTTMLIAATRISAAIRTITLQEMLAGKSKGWKSLTNPF